MVRGKRALHSSGIIFTVGSQNRNSNIYQPSKALAHVQFLMSTQNIVWAWPGTWRSANGDSHKVSFLPLSSTLPTSTTPEKLRETHTPTVSKAGTQYISCNSINSQRETSIVATSTLSNYSQGTVGKVNFIPVEKEHLNLT